MKKFALKGFTLVELIVVLVIIGILAAIAYVAYATLIDKSAENSLRTTAQSIDREAVALGAGNTPQDAGADNVTTVLNDADNGFSGSGPWTKGDVTVTANAGGTAYTLTSTDFGVSVCYTPEASDVGATAPAPTSGACA